MSYVIGEQVKAQMASLDFLEAMIKRREEKVLSSSLDRGRDVVSSQLHQLFLNVVIRGSTGELSSLGLFPLG